MNGRFRKASALLATVGLVTGGLAAGLVASAGPASATSDQTGCESVACTTGFSSGATTRTDGPFSLGVQFTTDRPGDLTTMCFPSGPADAEAGDAAHLSDGTTTIDGGTHNSGGGTTCVDFYALIPAGNWTVWYDDGTNLYDSGSAAGADLGSPTEVTNVNAVYGGTGTLPAGVADNYGVNFTWISAANAPSPATVSATGPTSANFHFEGDNLGGATTSYSCSSTDDGPLASGSGTSGANDIPLTGVTHDPTNVITCTASEVANGLTNGDVATATGGVQPLDPTGITATPTGLTSVVVGWTGDGAAGAVYHVACISLVDNSIHDVYPVPQSASPVTLTGFTNMPTQVLDCYVAEQWPDGEFSPVEFFVTDQDVFPTLFGASGPGCIPSGKVAAPTKLSAAAEAYPGAVVSWAPVDTNCLSGYLVNPSVGTAVFLSGHGTTVKVPGPYAFGSTVTFTVSAVTGSGVGPASAPISVTIGAPAAASAVKATRVSKGAVKVAFKAGKGNGAPIKSFTAKCGSKSASGKASPLTVKGLTAGKKYTCTVTATNSRGKSAGATSNVVKA